MRKPNFYFERKLWSRGFRLVCGLDEVGRGAFAGPVVAASVVFSPRNTKYEIPNTIRIDDSKKLTDKQRRIADSWIKKNSLSWGIGVASVSEINRLGLSRATYSAFRRSVAGVNIRGRNWIDYLLIDAFYIPYVRGLPIGGNKKIKSKELKKSSNKLVRRGKQLAIINGDEKCFSIAAASIIAKVYRDDLMIKLGNRSQYQKFGWERNKGYGTTEHRKAIRKLGATRWHRSKFVGKYTE